MNPDGLPPARRARWRAALAAVSLALFGLLAWAMAPVLPLESGLGLRALFGARGARPPPADVVVVAIDERSAAELGLPERPRQWPRRLHAQLLRALTAEGARLVAFDLTFDSPSPDDAAFAAGLREAGNVLLTSSLRTDLWRDGAAQGVVEQLKPAVAPIGDAALAQAPFVLPKDARVDAYWTFREGADHAPSLPVLALHLFEPEAVDALLALSCEADPQQGCFLPAGVGLASAADPVAPLRRLRERLAADPSHASAIARRLHLAPAGTLRAAPGRVEALLQLHRGEDVAYLDFHGPARTVPTVSYADVTAASAPAGLLRGKMVFVGYSAASAGAQDRLRDDYRTVFSDDTGVDLSGVEIAATAFANLREGRVLRRWPAPAEAAFLAGWGLLLGAMAWRLSPRAQWVASTTLAALYAGAAYTAFAQAAQWWPLVIPLALQWPAALALGLVVSHRRSRVERDRMHEAFGYFVPERVVKQLAQSPGKVAAAHRIAYGACLATDAERYTALAERLDPQALGETMNRYYAQLFGPVERHGGWVIDVIGDAMVAVWELAPSDAARRAHACQAALAMQAAIDAEPPGAPSRLPTRIGLHCGEMRIGTVGASQHYEFRAVGDAVNTASRLEGLNKLLGTRVLASAAMVADVDGLLLRPLGGFLLAGKRDAVDVVEVVAVRADAPLAWHERCTAFAAGLQHYRSGNAEAACRAWDALLHAWPDDGPARFYLARARRLVENSDDHDPALAFIVATK